MDGGDAVLTEMEKVLISGTGSSSSRSSSSSSRGSSSSSSSAAAGGSDNSYGTETGSYDDGGSYDYPYSYYDGTTTAPETDASRHVTITNIGTESRLDLGAGARVNMESRTEFEKTLSTSSGGSTTTFITNKTTVGGFK